LILNALLSGLYPQRLLAGFLGVGVISATALANLRLDGLVAPLRTLAAAGRAALPHREQTTTDKQGTKPVYRGVAALGRRAYNGPYQLVVPLEKKPARWMRQLTGRGVLQVLKSPF
jgi:hypothetical protein